MKQRYYHTQKGEVFLLSRSKERNGIVYLTCAHYRPSKRNPNGCRVNGKIGLDGVLVVDGLHSCRRPLTKGEYLSNEFRDRIFEVCSHSNGSSRQITDALIREVDRDGVSEETREFVRTDSFFEYVRSTVQSCKEPLYIESAMVTSSQGGSDPFTHPTLDRTSNEFVFYTKERLQSLPAEVMIFVDETYKMVPFPYKSCLNIIGYNRDLGELIPLFHALLKREGDEGVLKEHFHLFLSALSPKTTVIAVMTDFSSSLIQASRKVFSDARIIGCRFHFLQAIKKRLRSDFSDDEATQTSMMLHLKRLPGLKSEEELTNRLSLMVKAFLDNEKVIEFIYGYFQRMWMEKYPPELWMNNLPFRTNNPVETFHSRLKEVLDCKAKGPVVFREALRELYGSWKQVKTGLPPREKRSKKNSVTIRRDVETLLEEEKAKENNFKRKKKPYACSWCREHRNEVDITHTVKKCPYKLKQLKKKKT